MKSAYTDYLIGTLIAAVSLNAWYLMSIAIENNVLPENYTFLRDLIVAVAGAFVGAYFAFLYSKSMEDKKATAFRQQQDDKDAAFLNSELLKLVLQYEIIENYKQQYEKYSCADVFCERAFNMRAETYHGELNMNKIGELSLILCSELNFLLDLGRYQTGYINTIESIKIRNDFFVSVLQPEMKKLGLLDRKVHIEEFERLDFGIRNAALSAVDVAYTNIVESSIEAERLLQVFWTACKKVYPNHSFAQFLPLQKRDLSVDSE